MAISSLLAIPFVGIADRKGAAAVKVGELLSGQIGGDVIDADRGALVAFAGLFGAELAVGDVVVGYEARPAIVILVDVESQRWVSTTIAYFCSASI